MVGCDRQVVCTVDLTDEDIAAIEASEMGARLRASECRHWITADEMTATRGGRSRPEEGRGLGTGGIPHRSRARRA